MSTNLKKGYLYDQEVFHIKENPHIVLNKLFPVYQISRFLDVTMPVLTSRDSFEIDQSNTTGVISIDDFLNNEVYTQVIEQTRLKEFSPKDYYEKLLFTTLFNNVQNIENYSSITKILGVNDTQSRADFLNLRDLNKRFDENIDLIGSSYKTKPYVGETNNGKTVLNIPVTRI